jgi:hypothetical protein
MVYAYGPSSGDILAGLAAGRASMAHSPQGPHLDLDINGAGLGCSIPYRPGLEGKAIISRAMKGDILKVINRKGAAEIFTVPFGGTYSPSFPVENLSFYRLELYRPLLDAPILCALSNPVYIGQA